MVLVLCKKRDLNSVQAASIVCRAGHRNFRRYSAYLPTSSAFCGYRLKTVNGGTGFARLREKEQVGDCLPAFYIQRDLNSVQAASIVFGVEHRHFRRYSVYLLTSSAFRGYRLKTVNGGTGSRPFRAKKNRTPIGVLFFFWCGKRDLNKYT